MCVEWRSWRSGCQLCCVCHHKLHVALSLQRSVCRPQTSQVLNSSTILLLAHFHSPPANRCTPVADPKNLKMGGAEDNLSASSSFIANAHNDLYRSLLHEKRRLFGKIIEPMGGTPPPPPPLWIRHWCTHNQTIVLTSLLNPCETKSFFRIRCLHVVDGQNQSLNWYCHYYTDVSYYYVTAGRDGPFSPGSPHFLLCFICSYGMFMYFVDNFNMKLKNSGLNNHDDRLWGK